MFEFLLDLALEWDDVESYETYVIETPSENAHRTRFPGHSGGINLVDPPYKHDAMVGFRNGTGRRRYEAFRDAAVSAVLVLSPVPTIPSWLIDFAERIDESQDVAY